ncbi:MAG: HD domain-containing phosphohydrolase [Nitrospirota bacterium]
MENCSTGRVLVFSSNDEFVTSLCQMLLRADYTVEGFNAWNAALQALKEKQFDVFLVDAEMPEMDGIAVLRAAMKIDPHLAGVVITGQNQFDLAVEAMQLGAFDHIAKPFRLELLLSKISRGIELRRLRKSAEVYRCIFENAAEGIYLLDADGNFVTANLALSRMLGYESPDDLLMHTKDMWKQFYVEPERHTLLRCLLTERSVVSDFESEVYRKDKRTIWVAENVRAVRDQYGKTTCFRGTVRDVSGRKNMESALRENEIHLRLCAEKAEKDKEVLHEIIEEMCHSYADLEASFVKFVSAMVSVIDGKSPWLKGHSVRVASYAARIGREMGLGPEDLKKLRLAALLHDVGKIVDFDDLLNKPGKLSQDEFEQIKKHPVQGALILRKVKQMNDLVPIVRHHHERIDGRGYPDGLKGDQIPFISKILHVADSYDSMTVDRPHRQAPGRDFAFEELRRCNNTQFDPRVAEAALRVL